MVRIKRGPITKRRHKAVLDLAKGFTMARRRRFKVAQESVLHAGEYAFTGRKLRKRDFRRLWITRMNAALREMGVTYSSFIHILKSKNIVIDRKIMAFFAAEKPGVFKNMVEQLK